MLSDKLPFSPNGALGRDVSSILRGAARGDIECQRSLFSDRIDELFHPATLNQDAMLIAAEAVQFGRLVASHGEIRDVHRLAGVLCQASIVCRRGGRNDLGGFLMAETVSVLEQLAEHGDDTAAMASDILIRDEPVEFIERVRRLRHNYIPDEDSAQ